MLTLIKNNVTEIDNTEYMINECKRIKHEIDVLQAQYDKLKKSLTEGYFSNNSEFVGSEGLVLATFKTQNRSSFDSSKFKIDYPKLYSDYQKQQEIKVFLVK